MRDQQYSIAFSRVAKGEIFYKNGYAYNKRSNRTGMIVQPVEYHGTWFYFKNNELVVIDKHTNFDVSR